MTKSNFFQLIALILFVIGYSTQIQAQGVGINNTNSSPDPSAMLDVTSTTKGVLIPRMTSAQRTAINHPATGLIVYDTDNNNFWYYNSNAWVELSGISGGSRVGTYWDLAGNAISSGDFIGTTNNNPLEFKINSNLRARLTAKGQLEFLNTGYSVCIGEAAGATEVAGNQPKSVFIGYYAGNANNAYENTGVGYKALMYSTTGVQNTAVGSEALYGNDGGIGNTATGTQALYTNYSGEYNTANGAYCLHGNAYGSYNIANGTYALHANDGDGNTATGYSALVSNVSGDYNTALGYGSFNTTVTNTSNSTALGYNTPISGSNQIHLGNTSVTEIKGQVSFTTYSDARVKDNVTEDVAGLAFINRLRPVTYNFNVDRQNELMGIKDESDYPEKYDIEKIKYSGFLAQEVEQAANETGYNFSGVKAPKNGNELYGISYAEFTVPLVKAVQELSKENEILKAEIAKLKVLETQQTATNNRLEALEQLLLQSNK